MNYIIEFLKLVYKYKDWIPKFKTKTKEIATIELLELINKNRDTHLIIDNALMKSAIDHANWMCSSGLLTHVGDLGKTHGYRTSINKYSGSYVAEYLIIYAGESDKEIVELLISTIKSNDPNVKFTKIGYGRKNKYWCFLLGK